MLRFRSIASSASKLMISRSLWTSLKQPVAHQPLTLKTTRERVMLVLQLYDKIDPEKLTLDTDLMAEAGIDSLDHVEVMVAMEDEFLLGIPDGDSERLKTPRQIYQYIVDKMDVYE